MLTLPQLKRQHSAEPLSSGGATSNDTPASGTTPPPASIGRSITPPKATPVKPSEPALPTGDVTEAFLGSPLKKQRASVSGADENALRRRIAESSGRINEVLGNSDDKKVSTGSFGDKIASQPPAAISQNEDEEL